MIKYWRRLAYLLHHYRKKSTSLPYLPVRLWIEPTNFCNFQCIMCPNKELRKEEKGFLDFPLFKKIVDEAQDFAFDVNLAHRGESLLHPQLTEMIRYTQKKSLFIRLHTNGSLLTEEISNQIIGSGLDLLSFSLDGYNRESYEKIRIGGSFDQTIRNIHNLLEIKKSACAKKPRTVVEIIDLNNDNTEKKLLKKKKLQSLIKELPLDNFVIKKSHNWAGGSGESKEKKNYSVCPFPWNALVILWDGTVLPCTQDFFGCYSVGNVKDSSLREIWNDEKMLHLREKLVKAHISELRACSHCDRLWRDKFLGVPREYLWKFITKRMI